MPILTGICDTENTSPVAHITASANSGNAPLEVHLDAGQSSDLDQDTLQYLWEFNDGSTSDQLMVTRDYLQAGRYEVSLTVSDIHGGSDTQTIIVTVEDPSTDPTASYVLDTFNSSLYLLSTKNTHVVETHTFTNLGGRISPVGQAVLNIDLDSIETGIATRNERMREYLFETAVFKEAQITLQVDTDQLADLPVGHSVIQTISLLIELHGFS